MAPIWGGEGLHTQLIQGVPSHTGKPAENAEAVGCTQGLCGVFKFSWRALSTNSDSGPKSTCFLLSLPTRREGVCCCLHPSPWTAPSGDLAEHTALATPSSTVTTFTTVSMRVPISPSGVPFWGPPSSVSRTLARYMRCMNCQTRTTSPHPPPPPLDRLPASVAVSSPYSQTQGQGLRRKRGQGRRYGQKGPLFNLWILPTWWIRR